MNSRTFLLRLLAASLIWMAPEAAFAKMSIVYSKHNLSVTGPGQIKALNETRVCIFCHTPHNATPSTPLWNKDLNPFTYTLYDSSTLKSIPSQPTGPSRLCLSCHDGTVALGKTLGGDIPTNMELAGRPSDLGTDLSDDHPISFSFYAAQPNEELTSTPPAKLLFYGTDFKVECSTCHDPHDDTNGMFLRVDNSYSALCTCCHVKKGWEGSSHRTSGKAWNGLDPNPWPHTKWSTVGENGCEGCHTPHNAGGPKRLVNDLSEEDNCYPCHNGNVASLDIQAQFRKLSHHRVEDTTIGVTGNAHDPTEPPTMVKGHVECVDCHNPHAVNSRSASAPDVSGRLDLVSGVDQNGIAASTAAYEYEICYKCHADSNEVAPHVNRVINETNFRRKFDPINPSYHPVVSIGKNSMVPSIPSILAPSLTTSSMIYCTDCHDSDESPAVGGSGPRGPHGSIYSPILRERYETADGTLESYDNYALCYRCHNRQSILADQSFQKKSFGKTASRGGHSGHLAAGAPCSACHDPHGVQSVSFTGDHTKLINFDTLIAQPAAGQTVPLFSDKGSNAGSCTLVCHGITHTPGYTGTDPNTVDSTYP
ncbi:MAG: hypothetical protein M0017_12515 [Desulfobacteraceae bacterium]|nr:hypothetical protein [Desulfobacteraceae bacterium]